MLISIVSELLAESEGPYGLSLLRVVPDYGRYDPKREPGGPRFETKDNLLFDGELLIGTEADGALSDLPPGESFVLRRFASDPASDPIGAPAPFRYVAEPLELGSELPRDRVGLIVGSSREDADEVAAILSGDFYRIDEWYESGESRSTHLVLRDIEDLIKKADEVLDIGYDELEEILETVERTRTLPEERSCGEPSL